MDLKYIDKLIDVDKYYLYYKNEPILSAENLKKLKQDIKENINAPKKDIKVFVVSFGKNKNKDKLFIINCTKFTLTKKLALVIEENDFGQTITYSESQLDKKKFKLSDILKIIKAINDDKISFEKSSVPINDILKLK